MDLKFELTKIVNMDTSNMPPQEMLRALLEGQQVIAQQLIVMDAKLTLACDYLKEDGNQKHALASMFGFTGSRTNGNKPDGSQGKLDGVKPKSIS